MLDLDNNTIAYGKYIADRHTEIVRLTTENANLIEKCAQIQKRHAETVTKYKDTHRKYEVSIGDHVKLLNELRTKEENHNKRLNERKKELHTLTQSLHKRIKEKDEAIQQVETLTHENANLCRIHADLGQESAELKKENADLINTVYPLQARISELQTELASLRQLREADEKDRKEYDVIKAERDQLKKQIKARTCERERDDRKRGRSRSRSRQRYPRLRSRSRSVTHRLGHDRDSWPRSYRSRSRSRSNSRERKTYRERSYRSHNSFDNSASEKYTPHTSIHRKESSGADRQGTDNFSTSPCTANDPSTSRRVDVSGLAWKKNTSQTFGMENVPKGPKAKSSSMFDKKRKSSSNEKQPSTKDGGYRR
jgi:chromosome segregation ATPase